MEVRNLIGALLPAETSVSDQEELRRIETDRAKLLLWGLPKRGEDDAEKALTWALETLPRNVRAHLGEFRVQTDEKNLEIEEGFSPDPMLAKLEPGDISVDPNLAKIYDRLFLFEEIEEENLFLLRGRRRRPARIRGLKSSHAKLIGREAEKKEFRELLEQVTEDQGQVLGIIGEAGIGKTRLVEDLIEETQKKEIPFLHASYPIDTKEPYLAFRKIVRELAQGDARTLSRWNMKEIEIDFLRLLLEPDQKIKTLANLSDAEIQGGLFRATKRLIQASSQTPRVIFIDDLHWATSDDFKLIENLIQDLEKSRLLLVLIHRPLEERPWSQNLNYNEMKLQTFTDEEVEAFLKENLSVDRISRQDLEELLHLSLGSPLFLEEIVRKLRDDKLIEMERLPDGKRLLRLQDTLKASRLPRTIAGILDSGFDKLAPETRKALQWLSIQGSTFDVDEAELFFKEISISEEEVQKVQNLGYTYEKSVFPNRIHAFSHDLVFETIHETIPEKVKEEMNTDWGLFLEKKLGDSTVQDIQRLADTFMSSHDRERAFHWSLRAGKIFLERSNFPAALRYLEGAYKDSKSLKITNKEKDSLYFSLTSTLTDRSDFERARKVLKEWKKVGGKAPLELLLSECRLENEASDHRRVCEITEALYEKREDQKKEIEKVYEILVERIIALLFSGQTERCREEGEHLLQEIDASRYPEIHFRILGRISYTIYAGGDYEKGLRYLKRAEEVLNRPMKPSERMWLLRYYANAYWEGTKFEEAQRYYSEAIHVMEEMGLTSKLAWTLSARAQLNIDLGKFLEAFGDVQETREVLKIHADPILEAKILTVELDLFSEVGHLEKMEETILEIEKNYKPHLDQWNSLSFVNLKSHCFEAKGNYPKAIECKQEVARNYWKNGSPMAAVRCEGRLLLFLALHDLKTPQELLSDYQSLKEKMARIRIPKTLITFWAVEVSVAAFHAGMKPNLKEYNLRKMLPLWSQMDAYQAQLKFHWVRGNAKKYEYLMNEYQKLHKERRSQIPKEYHAHFEKHPLHSPEAVERIIKKGQN